MNVSQSAPHIFATGSVGQGVRASSAFPGLFSPVGPSLNRYVDGGFFCNVPAGILVHERADLIIASNPVGMMPTRERSGPVRSVLSRLVPGLAERFDDLRRSFFVMARAVGEFEGAWADVVFAPPLFQFDPSLMSEGPRVYANAKRPAESACERLQVLWKRLAQPRAGEA